MKACVWMVIGGLGLVLAEPFQAIAPLVNGDSGEHTEVIVINGSSATRDVSWKGYSTDGVALHSENVALGPFQRTVIEVSSESSIVWLALASDKEVSVLVSSHTAETRIAYWASTDTTGWIDVPHLARDTELFETTIGLVNAGDQATEISLHPRPEGETIALNPIGPQSQLVATSQAWFGLDAGRMDWLSIEAQQAGLAAMERFTVLPERDQTAALGLDGPRSDRLIFVHVAEDVDQFWTGLAFVNTGSQSLNVALTYFSSNGAVLADDEIVLDAGSKHTLLFDADNRQPVGTAWVDAKADRPDLIGYELFGSAHDSTSGFFAGISACTSAGDELVFPVLRSSAEEWTGVVAVNLGAEPADLVFEAIDDSGTVLGRRTEEDVAPGRKLVITAEALFGQQVSASATWIRAASGVPCWVGACLWGDSGNSRKVLSGSIAQPQSDMVFPPVDASGWETVAPEDLGWDTSLIPPFLDFLEDQHTRAFLVLADGKIALEHYAGTDLSGQAFDQGSSWYWASAGKTLTATLIGIAQDQGHLDIHHPSSDYLGEGWTSLAPQREERITVWHQLTMTTGLDDRVDDSDCTEPPCLQFLADPGTRWAYHNAPYTRLDGVIEGAVQSDFDPYFNHNLRDKIGMDGAWFYLGYNHVYFSTPRSMARFGLLILNRGIWDGQTVLGDAGYIYDMTHTSQDLNPSYGYLWWLNGKASYMVPGLQYVFSGSMAPHAPNDMFAAIGKNGQLINVVPSQNLVVVRMGDSPDESPVAITFQDQLWAHLSEIIAGPPSSSSE